MSGVGLGQAERIVPRRTDSTRTGSSSWNGPTRLTEPGAASTRRSTRCTSAVVTARVRCEVLGDRDDLVAAGQTGAEPRHAAAAVLEAEQRRALEVALGHLELRVGDAVGQHAVDHVVDDVEQLAQAGRGGAGVQHEHAGVGVARRRREHGVGQARAPRGPPGTGGSTCRRRGPGWPPTGRSGRGRAGPPRARPWRRGPARWVDGPPRARSGTNRRRRARAGRRPRRPAGTTRCARRPGRARARPAAATTRLAGRYQCAWKRGDGVALHRARPSSPTPSVSRPSG